jgi:hypothetical protein
LVCFVAEPATKQSAVPETILPDWRNAAATRAAYFK